MAAQGVSEVEITLSEAIGQRLRVLREERGIPREQLAMALEMGSENLRHYERGRSGLLLRMLPDIARVFGMTSLQLAALLLEPERVA